MRSFKRLKTKINENEDEARKITLDELQYFLSQEPMYRFPIAIMSISSDFSDALSFPIDFSFDSRSASASELVRQGKEVERREVEHDCS